MPACARKMSHCFREITSISKDVLILRDNFKGCGGGLCQRARVEQKLNDRHETVDHSLTLFKSQSSTVSHNVSLPLSSACLELFLLVAVHSKKCRFQRAVSSIPSLLCRVEKSFWLAVAKERMTPGKGGKELHFIFLPSVCHSKPSLPVTLCAGKSDFFKDQRITPCPNGT